MVSENEAIKVRIKFKKYGSLMYISHLDLSRTMQRIMVRSGIDIWYSEGFNPQPRIVFACPLPVGVESECELMDIKINSPMECDEIKRRLNDNFPSEMEVLEVYFPETKIKEIAYIDYEIRINSTKISDGICEKLENMFANDLFVIKKSKGSEKEINIKEYISSFSAKIEEGELVIRTVLCAGGDKNLNPELLVDTIRKNSELLNGSPLEEYYSILRKQILKSNLEIFK